MKEFDDNKIDDFLLGRLNETELKEFKNKLSMDQNFSKLVQQRQETIRYIDVLGDAALKERVKKLHKEAVKNLPSEQQPFRLISLLKYAAVIVFLIAAGLWFFQDSASGSGIYNDYYQAYELSFTKRGTSEDVIASAGRFYADGDYQNALDQINALPPEAVFANITLAQGISFLEVGQYQNAAIAFQKLIDQKDLIYEYHARWYLAMTFFKQGKDKEAKALIEQIARTAGSFNQQKAKEILKRF